MVLDMNHGNNSIETGSPLPDGHGRLRIVLVDDHNMVRQGLRQVLGMYPDLWLVGEGRDGEEAIRLVEQWHPAAVVMDISMPKMNGIDATKIIKSKYPHIVVIGISVHASDQERIAITTAGACSLIMKESALADLYGEIRGAVSRCAAA
jgi:two-component system, NarL family, invasion response regulator UvrY